MKVWRHPLCLLEAKLPILKEKRKILRTQSPPSSTAWGRWAWYSKLSSWPPFALCLSSQGPFQWWNSSQSFTSMTPGSTSDQLGSCLKTERMAFGTGTTLSHGILLEELWVELSILESCSPPSGWSILLTFCRSQLTLGMSVSFCLICSRCFSASPSMHLPSKLRTDLMPDYLQLYSWL